MPGFSRVAGREMGEHRQQTRGGRSACVRARVCVCARVSVCLCVRVCVGGWGADRKRGTAES